MTIDITIGKIIAKKPKKSIIDRINELDHYSYKTTIELIDFVDIEQCPDEEDGCTENDTDWPKSAFRSGEIKALSEFFREVMPDLISEIRPIKSSDTQIARIQPYLDRVNGLKYNGDSKQHYMRLQWFKFWCNRAVELYGKDAGIEFR